MTARRFFILLICVVLLSPLAAEICFGQRSAWQELIRQNSDVVDDSSIDWQERLILDVLTPEQARRYYRGTSSEDLVLESGQTLAEYLAARLNPPGNVYVPLPGSCELFQLEDLIEDESLSIGVRGQCGIPEEATAVILQLKTKAMGGNPRVKLWASDLPEPAEAVVDGSNSSLEDLKTMTAVVTLCARDRCRGELQIKGTDAGMVQAEVVGYFRLLGSTDGIGPGSGIQFYTEGASNNFFGDGAGAANTTGTSNAFFGAYAGTSNTTGNQNAFFGDVAGYTNTEGLYNSFFGYAAGYYNTTGSYNAFFGNAAGSWNTTGHDNSFFGTGAGVNNGEGYNNAFFGASAGYTNQGGSANAFFGHGAGYSNSSGARNTFIGRAAGGSISTENNITLVGAMSDGSAGITNATAVGYQAKVAQSNSLVLGSINGVNGAAASTQVGIGTTAPQRLLHIAGDNAVFRMDRSTNSAAFMIVRTGGSGGVLKNFVVGVDASGVNQGEFIINDLGTAVGGPGARRMTITNEGNAVFTGQVTATGFIQSSSREYKTEIETLEGSLDKVQQLRGVGFNWKETGERSIGLIAEEVAEVLPESVAWGEDGQDAIGVNYGSLVGLLVEATKEQRGKIDSQTREIERLQEQNESLGERLAAIESMLERR